MRPPQDTANKIILMNTAFLDITGVRPIWTPGVDALHCVLYISARVIKNMTVSATISVSGTQSEAKPICNPTMIAVVACPSYTEIVGDCHTYKCDFALPLSFPSDIYKMDAVYQICPSPSGCATMGTMKVSLPISLNVGPLTLSTLLASRQLFSASTLFDEPHSTSALSSQSTQVQSSTNEVDLRESPELMVPGFKSMLPKPEASASLSEISGLTGPNLGFVATIVALSVAAFVGASLCLYLSFLRVQKHGRVIRSVGYFDRDGKYRLKNINVQ